MPKISQQKKDKIAEQILSHLFSIAPQAHYTSKISFEIARDEEFTKALLQDLAKKQLVVRVTKNHEGKEYVRRERWRLSNKAFEVFARHQK